MKSPVDLVDAAVQHLEVLELQSGFLDCAACCKYTLEPDELRALSTMFDLIGDDLRKQVEIDKKANKRRPPYPRLFKGGPPGTAGA